MINVDARVYETKTDEQILAEMQQMQDRITETLIIEDNKYIYDYDTIKEIVDVYDFDEFNQVAGTNYTKESFLDIAMDSIENTDLTPQVIPTGICGQTWKIEGWNYVRTAQTKAVSNALVNDAKKLCRNLSCWWNHWWCSNFSCSSSCCNFDCSFSIGGCIL